ncbi:MAG: hypothetical protein U0R76_10880 [Candidatus Nanopelagicales bacterium]
MTEQTGGLPPQHQPHPLPEGMSWIVGSQPGVIFVQFFDATGMRVVFLSPEDASTFIRQVKEQMHRARSGLIVPGGGADVPHVNGRGA